MSRQVPSLMSYSVRQVPLEDIINIIDKLDMINPNSTEVLYSLALSMPGIVNFYANPEGWNSHEFYEDFMTVINNQGKVVDGGEVVYYWNLLRDDTYIAVYSSEGVDVQVKITDSLREIIGEILFYLKKNDIKAEDSIVVNITHLPLDYLNVYDCMVKEKEEEIALIMSHLSRWSLLYVDKITNFASADLDKIESGTLVMIDDEVIIIGLYRYSDDPEDLPVPAGLHFRSEDTLRILAILAFNPQSYDLRP